jgi:hypothetical protein
MGDAFSATMGERRGRPSSGSRSSVGPVGEDWWQRIAAETPAHAKLRDWIAECSAAGYSGLRLRGHEDPDVWQPWLTWATTDDGREYPFGEVDACWPALIEAWPQTLRNYIPGRGLIVGYLTQADRTRTLGLIDGLKIVPVTAPRQGWKVELSLDRGELHLNLPPLRLTGPKNAKAAAAVGLALFLHLLVYPNASDDELSQVAVDARWPGRAAART